MIYKVMRWKHIKQWLDGWLPLIVALMIIFGALTIVTTWIVLSLSNQSSLTIEKIKTNHEPNENYINEVGELYE